MPARHKISQDDGTDTEDTEGNMPARHKISQDDGTDEAEPEDVEGSGAKHR
jgi:hypothetical protein